MFGGIAKDFAQIGNNCVQVVFEINENIISPQPVSQVFTGDNRPWAFQQRSQNLERLFAELDLHSAFAELAGIEVNLEAIEADDA